MYQASVVIPNWNGKSFLEVCLKSLEKQTLKNFEVIIIDNGSSDGSVAFIKKNYPKMKIISLPKNIGFSPAVNLGIKKAKSENIILLNNDTKVDRNCFKRLVESAEKHPEVGMIAAKMLNFYNPKIIDSAGDYIDTVGHANNIGLGKKDAKKYNKEGFVFLVTGGGSLIKKEVFKKIGFFDEEYFAYFEDVDFCLRAQMVGFKAWYEPKAVIYHIHKATSSRVRDFAEYLQFRNMMQTIIKDFPKDLLIKNFHKILLVNLNTIKFLMLNGYFLAAIKAEWYIIKNFNQLLKKRSIIQASRVVPEDYLINNFTEKKLKLLRVGKINISI